MDKYGILLICMRDILYLYMSDEGSFILHPGCIQSWKTWKSHGIPFFISRPGKVMEIDSRFGKFIKGHGN